MTEHSKDDRDITESAAGVRDESVQTDLGAESLADALRVSFLFLAGILAVLAAVVFYRTCVTGVQPNQVGVKKLFGRIVGTADAGLTITWPFPIGGVELVEVQDKDLIVNDFWMHETPDEKIRTLDERKIPRGGLRPGWDGALLTGDRNLLHVQLTCTYTLRREFDPETEAHPAVLFKTNLADPLETIRAVVCRAAIHAAAKKTADGLLRADQTWFAREVLRDAQRQLDALGSGIRLSAVNLHRVTWPLRARPAYRAAQRALTDAAKRTNAAWGEAKAVLQTAAGDNYVKLVGSPLDLAGRGKDKAPAANPDEDYDLIGQYAAARSRRQAEEARELLEKIDNVLLSTATGGQASEIIARARARKSAIVERVGKRAKRFEEVLPKYKATPELMLRRLWAEVRDEILSSPTVTKCYVPVGDQKMNLLMNIPPEILKQTRVDLLKAMEEEKSP